MGCCALSYPGPLSSVLIFVGPELALYTLQCCVVLICFGFIAGTISHLAVKDVLVYGRKTSPRS